jgi:glutamate N-acetyltransferase / amino-acid N-acetyltransferase
MTNPTDQQALLQGEDAVRLPAGYRAAGVHAGIKRRPVPDMSLLVSDRPAVAAGVFTTNQSCAAPVQWSRSRVPQADARAVIVNSGNANACTGAAGRADAEQMAVQTAAALGVDADQVLVCSTGPIGVPLPMDRIAAGIPALVDALSDTGGEAAALGIWTTDLCIKHWTVTVELGGRPVTVTGIAKGAGMIEPKMATMLAFVLTDAAVASADLQTALKAAVDQSFNRITVDGDQSTNDTVLLLANGAAGQAQPLTPADPEWSAFCGALNTVTLQLAKKIVADGEGAEKQVTVQVRGAACEADADRMARAIANSFLVKTSWAGGRANWGRIMDVLGYAGGQLEPERVEIRYDDVVAARDGVASGAAQAALDAVVQQDAFTLTVDLHLGEAEALVYTCEITEEYVRINVE